LSSDISTRLDFTDIVKIFREIIDSKAFYSKNGNEASKDTVESNLIKVER
jgi:hypothetical protein